MANPSQVFNFSDTTATRKVFALNKRIRAVAGGTSASKTISVLIWLIDYCQTRKGKLASVVSESYPHLEKGAMLDFENIMKDRGYWNDDRWHSTKHTYTFETGSKLEFYSPDTYGKAHGPRRDVLFVNEANNLEYNIVDQLIVRTRDVIWMDWNPTSEFWFYTDMQGKRDDIDFITLTYKDNEALDATTVHEIETHKDNKAWWQVYGLGQLGEIETRIYKSWRLLDEIPYEARIERTGLDFGYSNDPTAIIDVYYYEGGYILDQVEYAKGLSNKQIAEFLMNKDPKGLVIADSAEPKSIDEIKTYKVRILPTVKGKDSVNNGIQFVQEQKISITKRSVETIKEYRNYLWLTDKDGKVVNEPTGEDHAMDAIRYALMSLMKPKTQATVFVPNRAGYLNPSPQTSIMKGSRVYIPSFKKK